MTCVFMMVTAFNGAKVRSSLLLLSWTQNQHKTYTSTNKMYSKWLCIKGHLRLKIEREKSRFYIFLLGKPFCSPNAVSSCSMWTTPHCPPFKSGDRELPRDWYYRARRRPGGEEGEGSGDPPRDNWNALCGELCRWDNPPTTTTRRKSLYERYIFSQEIFGCSVVWLWTFSSDCYVQVCGPPSWGKWPESGCLS